MVGLELDEHFSALVGLEPFVVTCMSLLSTKSIIEMCIIPVLMYMYGCENCMDYDRTVEEFEFVSGKTCQRVLRWAKYLSNTALDMESRLLSRKLGFRGLI